MGVSPHCVPLYFLGSLQYFADVRTANGTARTPQPISNSELPRRVAEGGSTPGVSSAPIPAPGVSAAFDLRVAR